MAQNHPVKKHQPISGQRFNQKESPLKMEKVSALESSPSAGTPSGTAALNSDAKVSTSTRELQPAQSQSLVQLYKKSGRGVVGNWLIS